MAQPRLVVVNSDDPAVRVHEETIEARVERVLRSWRSEGRQSTPVTLLAPGDGADLILVDGHHRWEAARRWSRDRGHPVRLMARRCAPEELTIAAAHRIVTSDHPAWKGPLPACRSESKEATLRRLWDAFPFACDDENWSITHDERQLEQAAAQGARIFRVPAFTLSEVMAIAARGERLPPRSTNFLPKAIEGSVSFPLDP